MDFMMVTSWFRLNTEVTRSQTFTFLCHHSKVHHHHGCPQGGLLSLKVQPEPQDQQGKSNVTMVIQFGGSFDLPNIPTGHSKFLPDIPNYYWTFHYFTGHSIIYLTFLGLLDIPFF